MATPTASPLTAPPYRLVGLQPDSRGVRPHPRHGDGLEPHRLPGLGSQQSNGRAGARRIAGRSRADQEAGLDRITYAVAAARIADALTQDVLLAPLEAGVIPLPHQLHALTRAVTGDRVRYLLADEVGLGKTIEAGLIFRELKLRGLVKRVLVVAPKGLVTQWVQEMQTHFGEEFRLLTPSEFSSWRNLTGSRERLAAVRSGRLPRRFHQAGRTAAGLVPWLAKEHQRAAPSLFQGISDPARDTGCSTDFRGGYRGRSGTRRETSRKARTDQCLDDGSARRSCGYQARPDQATCGWDRAVGDCDGP